jgi:thioredoxin 1
VFAKSDLLHVGEEDFEEQIIQSGKVAVVEFWASWCGPCQDVAPHVEALAKEYAGRAIVSRVNTDESGKLAKRLDVSSLPTILFFENGKLVDRIDGAVSPEVLEQKVKDLLWSEPEEATLLTLKEAERMLEMGLTTAEEFEATKKQILGEKDS